MRIEEELFQKYLVDEDKLVAYGFVPGNDKLSFAKDLPDENFQIIIEYNDGFSGRIIDLSTGDEYVNYRREDASGFSAEIKDKFIGLLKDIRDRCCVNQYYASEQAKRILAYIREAYGDTPESYGKPIRPLPRSERKATENGTQCSAAYRLIRLTKALLLHKKWR